MRAITSLPNWRTVGVLAVVVVAGFVIGMLAGRPAKAQDALPQTPSNNSVPALRTPAKDGSPDLREGGMLTAAVTGSSSVESWRLVYLPIHGPAVFPFNSFTWSGDVTTVFGLESPTIYGTAGDWQMYFPPSGTEMTVLAAKIYILGRSGQYDGAVNLTLETYDLDGNFRRTVSLAPMDMETTPVRQGLPLPCPATHRTWLSRQVRF